jgi:hypothetical protein
MKEGTLFIRLMRAVEGAENTRNLILAGRERFMSTGEDLVGAR